MKVDFPVLFKVRDKALLHHEATVQDTIIKKTNIEQEKQNKPKNTTKETKPKHNKPPNPIRPRGRNILTNMKNKNNYFCVSTHNW